MSLKHICSVILVLSFCFVGKTFAGPGPVGWWKLDHGSGSTAYDSSGNNYNGSIEDTTSWITGVVGDHALNIANGYISISDRSALRPSRLTVTAWVNLPGPQTDYARLLVKGNDNYESYNFQFGGLGLNFTCQDTGGGGHGVALTNPLWPDEWIFIAAVYDGSDMILYVNGEFDNSSSTGSFTPSTNNGPLVIGARAPNMDRRMSGSVDDVRVYNYALSPAEILSLYQDVRDPNIASEPNPENTAQNIPPDITLSWTAGQGALSHDVYLGTSSSSVDNATTSVQLGAYQGRYAPNSYDPDGLLQLNETYYWRIDEVDAASISKGRIWSFTCHDGKAQNPDPADGAYAETNALLSWTAAPLATLHDIYFETDYDAVNNADKSSYAYKTSTSSTTYNPGSLSEGANYYWRIDEVIGTTTVKGDIWQFSTTGGLHLKVDLGLPQCFDGGATVITDPPVPGTVKEGWWPFVAPRWADMYMHDAVWERGENGEGPPPDTDGIAGTGVHVAIDCGGIGNGGFHVYNLCRDNLGGGGCPSGSVQGDPIANGWFHNIDWGGERTGDILMRINGLPEGEYILVSYHNHWEPCTQGSRNCLNCLSNMPNMPAVTSQSLPAGPIPGYGGISFTPGTGTGVTPIQDAFDIDVTSVTSDDEVSTSVIRFYTDGSDVLVIYDGGDNTYPDPARPGREGSKAILNAFEIIAVGAVSGESETASNPYPTDDARGVRRDVELLWSPGVYAVSHDVYFGTDFDAVNNANTSSAAYKYRCPTGLNQYDPPGLLEYGTTYYWRIDAVNDSNAASPWVGDVWSFETPTAEVFILDNMESYNGTGNKIYNTWRDTFENPTSAYIELAITPQPIHDGSQAMNFYYQNSMNWGAGFFSRSDREISDPCDWLSLGVRTLSLWFYGDPANAATETMFLSLQDRSGTSITLSYPGAITDLQLAQWQQWTVDLQDFGYVDLSDINTVSIGFGDPQNQTTPGGNGTVYFDDIILSAPTCDPRHGPIGDLDDDCIVDWTDFREMAQLWLNSDASELDLIPDNIINFKDYAIQAQNWLDALLFPPP